MSFVTSFRSAAALMLWCVVWMPANAADLVAYWNFDELTIETASPPGMNGVPTSIDATEGAGTLGLTGFAGNIDDFTGTSINSIPPNTPGDTSLSVLPGADAVGNGGFLQFEFSMAGRTNLGVSYATQGTSTGFTSNQWSYSTDGTNYTPFGPVIVPASTYSLVGPLITTGLDNAPTAFLRYTLNGGQAGTGNNRIDNVRLEYNATESPPPNPPRLPQPGDVVFGLNSSNAEVTLELVRGPVTPSGGVKSPGPWSTTRFIQSVEFDNLGGQRHNARGNLLGIDFGTTANGGTIYSLATRGTIPAPDGQAIGNTRPAPNNLGHDGNLTVSRLAGLSVAPDNSKIAVVGTDAGTVIVYDYTAGDTRGAGASLANGRQTSTEASMRILATGATQGTAWKDHNNVYAFSAIGDLWEVDATTMTPTFRANVATPQIGSNFTSIAYNPDVSPYIYATYSGFSSMATPTSQSKLYVFDPANNYAAVTDADGVDLSLSSQTAREIALDEEGNLFISAFDSTITYIPSSMALNPATITDNSSIFWYQSTSAATSFVGFDIGFGEDVTLDGDYNGDGSVNAADFVVWRKNDGSQEGYDTWVENFGRTAGSGSSLAEAGAVPEPTTLALVLIGLCAVCHARSRG